MQKGNVDISVIVPVYNVESYLEECLNSIFSQTFSNYEVICVEDCSQDNSLEIVKKYQFMYSNFSLLENDKNEGLSYSRNRGIEYANGKYILFVDSDDIIRKDTLAQLYEQAEKKQLEILYFNKKTVYDKEWKGEQKKEKNYNFGNESVFTGKELFVHFLERKSLKSMNAYTQFFLRSFLLDNNLKFYNGIIHEDFLFYFQCAMKAKRVGNIDKVLYIYRKRNNSITDNVTELHKQSIYIILMEVLNYWKNNKFTKQEDVAIRNFCEIIYRSCKRYFDISNFNNPLTFGKAADQFLYDKMNKMMNREISFTYSELNRIKKADQVWIYGAGKIARETVMYFQMNNISICGCLVTSKEENNTHFFGWEIWQIDEAPVSQNTLIILAAAKPHKTEIVRILKEKNYTQVIYAVKEKRHK